MGKGKGRKHNTAINLCRNIIYNDCRSKTLYAWVKDSLGNISSISTASISINEIELTPNIVAWYEGDSATSTRINDAASGSVATFFNSPTINQTGQYGKSVRFNGTNQYATIPMLSSIFSAGMPNSFSLMIRFQQPTLGAGTALVEIPFDVSNYVYFMSNNGEFSAQMARSGTRYSKKRATNISTNTWYNAIITWNTATSTMKLYVDGVEQTTSTSQVGVNGGSASMWISKINLEATYSAQLLETFAVFNKVLTEAEIGYLQNKKFSDL